MSIMKPEEIALLSIVVSGLMSSITLVLGRILSKRVDLAGAKSQEGDASVALSNAARIQIETYNKEVILPMKQEMEEIRAENRALEMALDDEKNKNRKHIAMLEDEIARMKADQRKTQDALEYLVGATRQTHPNEVEIAYKILNGQLHM